MGRRFRYLLAGLALAMIVAYLGGAVWISIVVCMLMIIWGEASFRVRKLRYLLVWLAAAAYCGSICLGLVAFDVYGMAKSQIVNLVKDNSKLNPDSDLFVIEDALGRYGYIDNTGIVAIMPRFSYASAFHEGLAEVEVGDKRGYIDKTGSMVIQPQFSIAMEFSEGLACAELNKKWGYIDKTGKFVIPAQYSSASSFHNGYAQFTDSLISNSDGYLLYGIIDKTGKVILKPEYEFFYTESDGYICVMGGNGKYGYVDSNYKVVVKPVYTKAESFSNGLAAVENGSLWGMIDTQGNLKIPSQFNDIGPFSEGLAAVQNKESKLWGFIDVSGKLVIPYIYCSNPDNEPPQFVDGLACVAIDENKCILINNIGKTVISNFNFYGYIPPDSSVYEMTRAIPGEKLLNQVNQYGYCGNGLHWVVKKPGIITFFDNKGNVKFETDGDAAGTFSEGLCTVERNASQFYGEYGYIDRTGKRVIDFHFSYASEFVNGIAEAADIKKNVVSFDDKKYGYIDKTGKYFWLPTRFRQNAFKLAGVLLLIALALAADIIYYSRRKRSLLQVDSCGSPAQPTLRLPNLPLRGRWRRR